MKNIFQFFTIIFLFSSLVNGAITEKRKTVPEKAFGIMIGEPTGFSFKKWADGLIAWDLGLSWSFEAENNIHTHFDFLKHLYFDEEDVEEIRILPLYFGIGGRIKFSEKTKVGVRVPIGVEAVFSHIPLDLFFEIAPIMNIVPDTDLDFNVILGIRYFL